MYCMVGYQALCKHAGAAEVMFNNLTFHLMLYREYFQLIKAVSCSLT